MNILTEEEFQAYEQAKLNLSKARARRTRISNLKAVAHRAGNLQEIERTRAEFIKACEAYNEAQKQFFSHSWKSTSQTD